MNWTLVSSHCTHTAAARDIRTDRRYDRKIRLQCSWNSDENQRNQHQNNDQQIFATGSSVITSQSKGTVVGHYKSERCRTQIRWIYTKQAATVFLTMQYTLLFEQHWHLFLPSSYVVCRPYSTFQSIASYRTWLFHSSHSNKTVVVCFFSVDGLSSVGASTKLIVTWSRWHKDKACHIGGGFYVSVTTGFLCVDFRKFNCSFCICSTMRTSAFSWQRYCYMTSLYRSELAIIEDGCGGWMWHKRYAIGERR